MVRSSSGNDHMCSSANHHFIYSFQAEQWRSSLLKMKKVSVWMLFAQICWTFSIWSYMVTSWLYIVTTGPLLAPVLPRRYWYPIGCSSRMSKMKVLSHKWLSQLSTAFLNNNMCTSNDNPKTVLIGTPLCERLHLRGVVC